ncbi:hypothetical protein HN51_035196 [Arachis hypogaea]
MLWKWRRHDATGVEARREVQCWSSGGTRPLTWRLCDVTEGRRRRAAAALLARRTGAARRIVKEGAAAASVAGRTGTVRHMGEESVSGTAAVKCVGNGVTEKEEQSGCGKRRERWKVRG